MNPRVKLNTVENWKSLEENIESYWTEEKKEKERAHLKSWMQKDKEWIIKEMCRLGKYLVGLLNHYQIVLTWVEGNEETYKCATIGSFLYKTMACNDVLTLLVLMANKIDDLTIRKVTIHTCRISKGALGSYVAKKNSNLFVIW